MLNGFIINNNMLFDSEQFTLYALHKGKIATLSGTKGRCMLCLLSHHHNNEISTKKALFYDIWEKHGLFSTDSCLLQTVYSLRKDLNQIGLTSFVTTQPRLGYSISPSYYIQQANDEASALWHSEDDLSLESQREESGKTDLTVFIRAINLFKISNKIWIRLPVLAFVLAAFCLTLATRTSMPVRNADPTGVNMVVANTLPPLKRNILECYCKPDKHTSKIFHQYLFRRCVCMDTHAYSPLPPK